mgnify:CR=1 FL=1
MGRLAISALGVFLLCRHVFWNICRRLVLRASVIGEDKKFAVDNQLIVRYEELKHSIKEQNRERREKIRFLMAFKSDAPFKEQMEHYLEKSLESGKRRFEQARDDVKNKVENVRWKEK